MISTPASDASVCTETTMALGACVGRMTLPASAVAHRPRTAIPCKMDCFSFIKGGQNRYAQLLQEATLSHPIQKLLRKIEASRALRQSQMRDRLHVGTGKWQGPQK